MKQKLPWDLKYHPGYFGAFSTQTAKGAMENGTRIVKVRTDPSDTNPIGTMGKVLGSIAEPNVTYPNIMYFIEWDTSPKVAVSCAAWKIARVQ